MGGVEDYGCCRRIYDSAVNTMYELSADRMIKEQCRRRASYEKFQKHQAAEIVSLNKALADKDAVITDRDAMIAEQQALINQLMEQVNPKSQNMPKK